ncbi:DNA cytosine methyltransferase [Sphingomonas sp. SUN019]|uniref:DNA cytosine methyltransferase n=1 Tax=Sphingomonas sp. SUN019 TaxID=2937788 RepID=UPI0021643151|nr:DNA cytosine methyltransferase [Sphingomonas sp. SUN019]UVO51551.1 DNA cytosine methyltransferase [Sphingomonas sp. SUN019]
MVTMMDERPVFYEFFAGGGMARAGLGAGWDCLFANDFDPKKGAAYAENWGDAALHVGDVGAVTTAQLPERADLVWASFPCQDLSLAGAGAGLSGGRSGAFWPFWRLIEGLRAEGRKPRTIVLENVCGLLTSNDGADFAALCATVAKAGYWIGAMVVDAQLFLPQSRPRLFVVAIDDSLPVPGHIQSPWALDRWHPARLRAAQAALPEQLRSMWLWFAPPQPPKRNARLIDLIEDEPHDVAWRSDAETAKILAMMTPVNRAKIDLVAANGGKSVGAVYKRTRIEQGRKMQRAEVRFDLAGCLRTPGGGSSRQTIVAVEDGRVRTRLISARETARLMGLPEEYRLPLRYNDAYHLTGDGVAVPVVRHIAETILEPVLHQREVRIVAA